MNSPVLAQPVSSARAGGGQLITNIQLLRGLAALMVVVFHLAVKLQPFGTDGSAVASLQAGVDIFFVISGFIMVYVSHQRERGGTRFLADRIIRIVPLYWVLTLATCLVLPASHRPQADLLPSLFFIPNGAGPVFKPPLGGGWSLNLEMYFYCVFALALTLDRTRQKQVEIATLLLLAVVALSHFMPGKLWPFYGNELVFEFMIGMGLAKLGARIGAITPPLAWALIAAGSSLIALDPFAHLDSRLLSWGLPASLIVAAALALDQAGYRVRAAPPLLLGSVSYALYLSHGLVVYPVQSLNLPIGAGGNPALVFAVLGATLLITLGFAWLVYRFFEAPVTRLLKQRLASRHGRPACPSPLPA